MRNQALSSNKRCKKIAQKGQEKYFRLFNEIEVAKYIIDESISGISKPIWGKYIK